MKILFFLFLFITSISILANDSNTMTTISTDETVVSSCSLSIKVNSLYSNQDSVPKVGIEVTLLGKDGVPIADRPFQITATMGSFLCTDNTASSSSDNYSCFTTNLDGKSTVILTNIPFNSPIHVKASCDCGDYQVYATGNVLITKKTKTTHR